MCGIYRVPVVYAFLDVDRGVLATGYSIVEVDKEIGSNSIYISAFPIVF